MVSPTGTLHLYWDVFFSLSLAYMAGAIPFIISFVQTRRTPKHTTGNWGLHAWLQPTAV